MSVQKMEIASITIITVITIVISVVAHRLMLHPLASHKGPLLARITAWPNWFHAAKGDRHIWLLHLHSQYGPAVRFEPNSVSLNTPLAVNSIYSSRHANVRKGDWYQCIRDFASGHESTITARDKARHALKRRILAHAFSERALKEFEPRIKLLTSRWLHQLDLLRSEGHSVDFASWSNYVIFDILGDLCYSKDFALSSSEQNRYVTQLLPRTTHSWYKLGYHPCSHPLRYLLFKTGLKSTLGSAVTRDNSKFRDFCVAALMERVKLGAESKRSDSISHDMFDHLLKAKDPETGVGFTMPELGAESTLLMIAGTHTTSVAIASALFYLTKNKEKLQNLTREFQAAFTSFENMNYQQLASLPYLRACINETLRMSPPTAGHLQREVMRHGIEIDGSFYRSGTNIGVSAYALQHNPFVWPDPNEFIPERWLQSNGKHLSSNQPGLFAFSSGPMGCPGKQLAYMEMSIVIAMLISQFDMILDEVDAAREDYVLQDCFVGQGQGPHIFLRQRTTCQSEVS